MVSIAATEILVGVYLGLLAAIFPSFIAFSIGFGFKYFTTITVPGLGVVALGGALAGVSGGLMGLMDPNLAESWIGITAVLVILMACLWAHSQGDKLGAATPRRMTLKNLRGMKLSADIADRVDSYGQIRIRSVGDIQDIEGYPLLPDDLRETLQTGSWKFPANLSLAELESRLLVYYFVRTDSIGPLEETPHGKPTVATEHRCRNDRYHTDCCRLSPAGHRPYESDDDRYIVTTIRLSPRRVRRPVPRYPP